MAGDQCETCGGTGSGDDPISDGRCDHCDGTGKKPVRAPNSWALDDDNDEA